MPSGFSWLGDFKVEEAGGELVSASVGDKALRSSCADGTTIEVDGTTGKLGLVVAGSSLASGIPRSSMSKYAGVWFQGTVGISSTDAGKGLALENTYGSDLIVDRAILYIATAESTAETMTIDIGISVDGSASDDKIIDGADLKTTGATDNIKSAVADGSNARTCISWESGEFIVGTISAVGTECVAYYAIHVLDMTA